MSGHGRPATRREFLARGLIAGTATVFLPSIATLLAREVHAQTGCQIASGGTLGAGKIPFLAIDQAGGANIAGSNVMVGKAGGQLDFLDPAGYAKLGLAGRDSPADGRGRHDVRPRAASEQRAAARPAQQDERDDAREHERLRRAGALGERHRQQPAQPDLRHRARGRERRVRRDDRLAEHRVGRQLGRARVHGHGRLAADEGQQPHRGDGARRGQHEHVSERPRRAGRGDR